MMSTKVEVFFFLFWGRCCESSVCFLFHLFRVDVAVYLKGEFLVSRRSVNVVCAVLAGAKQS